MNDTYQSTGYKLIYIFTIADEAHKGLVKVGDATIHTSASIGDLPPNCASLLSAAEKNRIKNYTVTVGVKVDIRWAELAVFKKEDQIDGLQVTILTPFRDHDVHDVLKNSGIKVAYPNGVKGREWFECDVETAKRAIVAVKEGRSVLAESEKSFQPVAPKIELREEQKKAVKDTLAYFANTDKVLWNCKMRFGKTLTAYELIRRGKFQKTLVVTHRPVVQDEWEEEHGKMFGEGSLHLFMKKQGNCYSEDYFDSTIDIRNDIALNNASRRGDFFIYFASMQDLRGSKLVDGNFDKNKAVFGMDWDLIIYDEAHEGTQTDLGQKVQARLEQAKGGKKPKVLELSGTPYNILDKYGDNVVTWDYVMEQEAKARWAYEHPTERNPYADMPRMNIFTFDMSKALATSYRFVTETSAFNFHEFFRVWTGDPKVDFEAIPYGKEVGDFVHEEDVRAFLDIITTESEDTKYPFATDEFRKEFKHTFWMLPGVKEARALSALLQHHAVFSHYRVINVAGDGDEEMPYDNACALVKREIARNEYTITLSCGKLTTGVTVREWTAVMMLTGGATTDAKGYMQTIFRVQSAGTIEGKQKENCYVFDFAPDRALRVISEAHRLSKRGQLSDAKYRDELGKFLNFCPVHAIEGVRMTSYDVASMMRQIKRISVDSAIKSGFEDDSIYKVDTGIVMDDRDREFFEALRSRLEAHKKTRSPSRVVVASNGMTNEEYEKAKAAEKKAPRERTPEEKAAMEKERAARKQRETFLALLRNISIRLPLLIFGADVPFEEGITMEKFIDIVDDDSWKEFLPADVTKDIFRRSIKYFDEDVLIGAGMRIRRLVKQADEYPPTERIRRITELFGHFRNPDKETVLTPWRVVNMHMSDTIGGYCFFGEDFDPQKPLEVPRFVDQGKVTSDLFSNPNVKILEINSKSGLYPLYVAYSLYRSRLTQPEDTMSAEEQSKVWEEVLRDNVFVLCKTKMAEAITRRTLAGFGDAAVNTRYQAHLMEKLQSDMDWVVKKIKNPESWKKGGTEMKFDAIVGNPPYQSMTGTVTAQATPVYHWLVDLSKRVSSQYISMIIPSKWFAGGMGLDQFRKSMLEDTKLRKIYDYTNAKDCFPTASIGGGVNYFLWDATYDGECSLTNIHNGERSTKLRRLNDYATFIRFNEAIDIIEKVEHIGTQNVIPIISSLSPFGLGSSIRGEEQYFPDALTVYSSGGKGYIAPNEVKDGFDSINKYKVMISYVTSEHAGEADKNGQYKVLSRIQLLEPKEVCTFSYFLMGISDSKLYGENIVSYLKTRFVRFLLLQAISSIHISKDKFLYVPMQDFTEQSDIDWSKPIPEIDAQLYKKYGLTEEEISFIESMIKPMA